jgi:hypothetical protein
MRPLTSPPGLVARLDVERRFLGEEAPSMGGRKAVGKCSTWARKKVNYIKYYVRDSYSEES